MCAFRRSLPQRLLQARFMHTLEARMQTQPDAPHRLRPSQPGAPEPPPRLGKGSGPAVRPVPKMGTARSNSASCKIEPSAAYPQRTSRSRSLGQHSGQHSPGSRQACSGSASSLRPDSAPAGTTTPDLVLGSGGPALTTSVSLVCALGTPAPGPVPLVAKVAEPMQPDFETGRPLPTSPSSLTTRIPLDRACKSAVPSTLKQPLVPQSGSAGALPYGGPSVPRSSPPDPKLQDVAVAGGRMQMCAPATNNKMAVVAADLSSLDLFTASSRADGSTVFVDSAGAIVRPITRRGGDGTPRSLPIASAPENYLAETDSHHAVSLHQSHESLAFCGRPIAPHCDRPSSSSPRGVSSEALAGAQKWQWLEYKPGEGTGSPAMLHQTAAWGAVLSPVSPPSNSSCRALSGLVVDHSHMQIQTYAGAVRPPGSAALRASGHGRLCTSTLAFARGSSPSAPPHPAAAWAAQQQHRQQQPTPASTSRNKSPATARTNLVGCHDCAPRMHTPVHQRTPRRTPQRTPSLHRRPPVASTPPPHHSIKVSD
eukprot:gene2688-3350_t